MTTHLTDAKKSQIRIALATWEGWTEIETRMGDHISGRHPNRPPTMFGEFIPNYPADLNDCHAIEVKLTDEEWEAYQSTLHKITEKCGTYWNRPTISASAEHRALALYRSLNLGELGD